MPRSPNWKRSLFKLGVFLLLGAIVNVAVAWGCALWTNLYQQQSENGVFHQHKSGSIVMGTLSVNQGRGVCTVFLAGQVLPALDSPLPSGVPYWAQETIRQSREWVTLDGRGWPLISLWSTRDQYLRPMDGLETQLIDTSFGGSWPRVLPQRLAWPGFAINTIFYAALLWVLFCGPGKIRRLVRIRQGRCPACGYQIAHGTGAACSECGHPLRHLAQS